MVPGVVGRGMDGNVAERGTSAGFNQACGHVAVAGAAASVSSAYRAPGPAPLGSRDAYMRAPRSVALAV